MNAEKELLKALKYIKENPPGGSYFGICTQINNCFYTYEEGPRATALFSVTAQKWPKYSGNSTYPVPDPDKPGVCGRAEHIFNETCSRNMWNPEHSYGALRLELLDFCIDYLEQNHG